MSSVKNTSANNPPTGICRGGNSCCSPENRCYINEGDCDQNDDCTYGLV